MRIDIGDVRIYVDVLSDAGSPPGSRPFLLALHGGPGLDHSVLRPGIDVLCEDFQVVVVDQRGHGRSDRDVRERWRLDVWADDVRRICDALDAERPLVLGVSFGGTVALRYAARHPGHAAGVISVSGSAHRDREASARMFERIAGPDVAEIARRHWANPTPESLVAFRDRCMPHYTTTGRVSTTSAIRNQELMLHWLAGEDRTFDLRGELANIACPVLALTGDSDPVAPVDIAVAIGANTPECEVVVVPNAGHGVFRDQPSGFAAAVRDWASRHDLLPGVR